MLCSVTNAADSLPETCADDAPMGADARARGRIERQWRVLDELAGIGLEVARAAERQARAAGPETDIEAIAAAYAKAARAVRLAVLLQSRLVQELQRLEVRAEIAARSPDALEEARRSAPDYVHKARVEAIVERVAREACGGDGPAVDRLVIEAGERLDDEDLYGQVLNRPVGELVALICRDLGLDPDWARLAEEAWAQDEIARGADGSPFLALGPADGHPDALPRGGGDTSLRSLFPGAFRDTD